MTALLDHLTAARAGHKLLVPYVMAGSPEPGAYPDAVRSVARHADAVEIGIPFSDPLMDGPVIAAAAERALRAGIGPLEALELGAGEDIGAPRVAMTYYNPVHRLGEGEFCRRAAKAGFGGIIVPDLPLEESEGLRGAAADEGLAWIPLVAPTSTPPRVEAIAAGATGFIYAVSTLGVTGPRESLSERAAAVVNACRAVTDLPVLVGIGISTPEQAAEASSVSDGVIVGSAVVSRLAEEGAEAAADFLARVREALDKAENT